MKTGLAVYAGSFDPPTKGHLWMITKGAALFDQLIVAIGSNPEKRCLFSVDERLEMLSLSTNNLRNVAIKSFPFQYLVNFAKSQGAQFVLRGIRSSDDFGKEKDMCHINADLNPSITMVYLMPPRELAEISSSMVKGLVGPEHWEEVVTRYVPAPVFTKLKEKYGSQTT